MPIKQNLNLNKILTPWQLLGNHLSISSQNLLDVIVARPELGQDFVFEHVCYFRGCGELRVLLILLEILPRHPGTGHHRSEPGVRVRMEAGEFLRCLAPHSSWAGSHGGWRAGKNHLIFVYVCMYVYVYLSLLLMRMSRTNWPTFDLGQWIKSSRSPSLLIRGREDSPWLGVRLHLLTSRRGPGPGDCRPSVVFSSHGPKLPSGDHPCQANTGRGQRHEWPGATNLFLVNT